MKGIRLFLLAFYVTFLAFGHNQAYANEMDSLLRVIKAEKNPKISSDKYLMYISKVASEERDSGVKLLDAAIAKYQKSNFKYGLARAISLKSWYVLFDSKYEESFKLAHQALKIQKTINDTSGIANTINRLGIANLQFKRFKDAKKYFVEAHAMFVILRDTTKIDMTLNNLGVLAFEQGNNLEAIDYYRQSLEIRRAQKKHYWVAYALYNIGESYLKENKMDSAEYYLLTAHKTFIELAQKPVPAMVSVGLAELYYEKQDYSKALTYAEIGVADAEKKGHTEIVLEGKEILSSILFKLNRFKEAYEIKSEYLNLKNTVDSSNNAATVAEIEEKYKHSEKEVEIEKLKSEKLKAVNKVQSFKIYALTVTALIILILAVVIILWQRRNQKEKLERSTLNAKIAEARMFALRAQMNPHFIFNCINTAQSFIMQNQREQANEYLGNFSKLLRLVLENSAKTFVPFEDELTQIKLYLELEAIRFEHKFEYELVLDPELEHGNYEIPGMCIQPLIENAIGHGLINRNDDKGKLRIEINYFEDALICEITDNGVGRTKAAEIKSLKNNRYQSTAIPNITERLEMLKSETGQDIKLETFDLTENAIAIGTKVILTLPCQ